MNVHAQVLAIQTINTDTEPGKANQPVIEIALGMTPDVGQPQAIKFTEMLSNLAGMDDAAVTAHFRAIIEDYVKTAFGGQQQLDVNKEWVGTEKIVGLEHDVEV